MGLFDKLKLQLLKVIEWTDSSSDTLVYRFEIPDRKAIMKGSQLTVRESQMAVFVVEGKIADVFGPGRHKHEEAKNIPILTSIFAWKYSNKTHQRGSYTSTE
jgi:membrane protease subunit (stomatin/prohibitin family)